MTNSNSMTGVILHLGAFQVPSEREPSIFRSAKLRPLVDMSRPGGACHGITRAAVAALSKSTVFTSFLICRKN